MVVCCFVGFFCFFLKQHKTSVDLCHLVMDSVFYVTHLLVLKQEVEAPYETII